jgi:hypothetical protein
MVPVQGQEMSMHTRGAGKHVNSYSTWYQFKDNMNLCVAMMQKNWFSLCLKFSTGLADKLVAFQQNVIGLQKMNCYIISQLANPEDTPLYFDMPSNDVVNYVGTHPVVIRT